ncbi:hypothetical protein [Devosia sp. SL43]|uniref:hypothetical protein n=1 Tax=Devosia sp. SL43 TaxID=2806348 RepID=UPI001F47E720|nr:hypothetical protein [Devosia sp. SL43]UJW86976.1 hypothetical protein IM737_06960 [Devosia sp. SL43]
MSKALPIALALLLATPTLAEEWHYENASVPIAYFDTGAAQLQFACRGGDLALGFWVRKPNAAVAQAGSMSVAITPDAAADSPVSATSGTSFAQEIPLIHSDGSSVIVRGPVARQWARIAQQAGETIRVAYVRQKASGALEAFDVTVFGAKGSKSAIGKVLERCG